ncbi:hypothetical protein ERJ75_000083500 [Trypanosoma vivax]|nr:hypothetical protein TRVL_09209 [Trypanosoma vivax]KAH8620273.1 hypothetical protein ERJ75_000083500 [Trypanosoma vivax]
MSHAREFGHNVSQCRNVTRLDGRLPLRHVAEELSSALNNFSESGEAMKRLWAVVTSMTACVHANCDLLKRIHCVFTSGQLKVLMEESRWSRESAVANLSNAIRLHSTAVEQNVRVRLQRSSDALRKRKR